MPNPALAQDLVRSAAFRLLQAGVADHDCRLFWTDEVQRHIGAGVRLAERAREQSEAHVESAVEIVAARLVAAAAPPDRTALRDDLRLLKVMVLAANSGDADAQTWLRDHMVLLGAVLTAATQAL